MTDERRYRDEEIREILDLATDSAAAGHPESPCERGLTLAELQEVAREVDLNPERIAEAALALDGRQDVRPRLTSFGLPVSIGRTIELPREVTNREWDILVSALRETFGARGKVRVHGGVREWSHGTLQAFLEPTENGHRLRLHDGRFGARFLNRLGATGLAIGLSLGTVLIATGQSPVFLELGLISSMLVGGAALFSNILRLPLWALAREGQMAGVANRVRTMISGNPSGEESKD